ncbi:NAD(P)-dependent malic enzyme [Levilactobacillus suantsaii]|uniref:NADP-dependent malic enzyme n=1 Tax=Levilactobacillus suantsaii TaxID=2292255 RepID=A0A4Q0VIX1_9LACO|nr:malic enzyme-like NAD(P)-binding protein [Levilactobacillus suantsaii]QMU08652.1 NADP-dependent malic enzyme [Levilactobacillus suantsaii]RXI78575.1 NADP-dependent malic enzyme [Levilactobacillus suantsaii]
MADLDEIIKLHERATGVLDISSELPVNNAADLGKAYTPGVAGISKLIAAHPEMKRKLTLSGKLVAVVTDGSAVLGLGNIGPAGGLPVVEGKALLYKYLAGVDALPLAVDQVPVDQVVATIKNTAQSFAGIHLEDIAAPRCFEIEDQLKQVLDIPVYHDDQEGTAIVVLAGLINAAKVTHKSLSDLKVVVNGVGASGIATAKLLYAAGIHQLTLVDKDGLVTPDDTDYNRYQRDLAKQVGETRAPKTPLSQVMTDQDAFVGLSDADVLTGTDVDHMASDPIIFALANPKPEIDPQVAHDHHVGVMATGSSQYPNQVNNILVFPGLFAGLLASGLRTVNADLETSVAHALAGMIATPTADEIIPSVFADGVVDTVTVAVKAFAEK